MSSDNEFLNFMEWLKEVHPEIHKKYGRNFMRSIRDGKSVAVNNNYKISQNEFEMLHTIAKSYYNTDSK